MTRCVFDHLVVTAPDLRVGEAFVAELVGVGSDAGGEHPRMGTHNRLWRLGEGAFLEVIAPNPEATVPSRPRWFGLDALRFDVPARLAGWVARTTDIRASVAESPESLGVIEPISRGALEWLITIPEDGSLPADGAAPALIEWQAPAHPADELPDRQLSLAKLEIFHPQPARIEEVLTVLQLTGAFVVARATPDRPTGLRAHIDTPRGRCVLA